MISSQQHKMKGLRSLLLVCAPVAELALRLRRHEGFLRSTCAGAYPSPAFCLDNGCESSPWSFGLTFVLTRAAEPRYALV